MDTNNLISLIEKALLEVDNVVVKSKYYTDDKEPIVSAKKVLNLLKDEIQCNSIIHERVLRSVHDLGMSAFKDFENTPLEDAIVNLIEVLANEIPQYRKLEPLRMDFGKGNPI